MENTVVQVAPEPDPTSRTIRLQVTVPFDVPGPDLKGPSSDATVADGYCPLARDLTHCVHWWDGDHACCTCGFD